jgi:phosphomannomutase
MRPDGHEYRVATRLPSAMKSFEAVFKAYDVRGVVPAELDADMCRAIGVAFARFCGSKRVIVARDARASGVELAAAFMDGVLSECVEIADLGLASTDMLYFASGKLDLPAVMFTASHNPGRYNGMKFCLAGARPIGVETGLMDIRSIAEAAYDAAAARADSNPISGREVRDATAAGAPEASGPSGAKGVARAAKVDLLQDFAEHVRSFVDLSVLRPLKVVADVANGMGGLVVPRVFEELPFDLHILYPELDGTFPNHPADPIQPENLEDLKAEVLSREADVGLAFDGDADRVFLVDEKAEGVSGSLTTALVAKAMLAKQPGSTILHNLICSKVVPEVIAENGGTAVRTRVGHSFIKGIMASTDAVFGGEHSGHYYFRDNFRADSGLIAALLVLEVMSVAGKPLSELVSEFRRYASSGEINFTVADPASAVESAAALYASSGADVDLMDGLTVVMGNWWFNLRPSNTEPLLRLNVEAPTEEECLRRVGEVRSSLEDAKLLGNK